MNKTKMIEFYTGNCSELTYYVCKIVGVCDNPTCDLKKQFPGRR